MEISVSWFGIGDKCDASLPSHLNQHHKQKQDDENLYMEICFLAWNQVLQFPPRILLTARHTRYYVIKFISNLQQVGGFLWVLWCHPPINLMHCHDIAEILLKVALNIITLTHEIKNKMCGGPHMVHYQLSNQKQAEEYL